MKICSHCNQDKVLSDFYKLKHASFGVSHICKDCSKIESHRNYLNNQARYKERAKVWVANNPEKRREIVNNYDKRNLEEKRKRGRIDSIKKRILDPEEERMKGRYYAHIIRSGIKTIDCDITITQMKLIIKAAAGICVYCNKHFNRLTIDHFIPLSKGGEHRVANLIVCCQSCNSSKNDNNGYDWLIKNNNVKALKRMESFLKKSFKITEELHSAYVMKRKLMLEKYGIKILEK